MQMEIFAPSQDQVLEPVRWNYEELKASLSAALKKYDGIEYTPDTIKDAKKDRASLNKLSAAIDARRKDMKAYYLRPYEEFERQAKELTGLIGDRSSDIDRQVKEYETAQKEDKKDSLKAYYDIKIGDLYSLVTFDQVFKPEWLNTTCTLKNACKQMAAIIDNAGKALAAIDSLGLDADTANHVKTRYLKDFDIAAAMEEKERVEDQKRKLDKLKAKQAAERQMREAQTDPQRDETPQCGISDSQQAESAPAERLGPHAKPLTTLYFRVMVTDEQAAALKQFLISNGIEYGRA